LRERLAQSLVGSRVRCYPGLVGRRSGINRLEERADHISTSVDGASSCAIEVPYIDLESIVPQDHRIALIKCDIEGSEADFLESYSALLARTDNVVIEVHTMVCEASRCHDILRDAGFVLLHHVKDAPGLTVDLFSRRVVN
jgi:FkbM family methyltransferase